MNKEEFLKEVERLEYIQYKICNGKPCPTCILDDYCNADETLAHKYSILWDYVEKHPPKTRQSEFLKLYPNARRFIDTEILTICPNEMDTTCQKLDCLKSSCEDCLQEYWLKEID